jgi:two-component system response regulator CssR
LERKAAKTPAGVWAWGDPAGAKRRGGSPERPKVREAAWSGNQQSNFTEPFHKRRMKIEVRYHMSYKIFLVEDEASLNDILKLYLQKEGFEVTPFLNGNMARNCIEEQPDLWILDIMLPDMDGFELLKEIKKKDQDVPIIFISARDQDIDRIIGLEMGSDDYLAKPFMPRELVIRVQKLLKRVYQPNTAKEAITINEYMIEIEKRRVKDHEEEILLTAKEFDLLLLLVRKKGGSITREQILNEVWGEDYFGSDRVVDDLVRRLRKKMPKLKVETLYGYGYRLSG